MSLTKIARSDRSSSRAKKPDAEGSSERVTKVSSSPCWHVICSEYPPQVGGVSDYTYALAAGLAAEGDEVCVWCPSYAGAQPQLEGVVVRRELGAIARADMRLVGQQLDRFPAPRRLLVQWVPHGYGYRSMNVPFCWWLWNRAKHHGDHVEIMVHEPYLPFRAGAWRQNAAALIHRLMTVILLRAAARVWVSIPQWEPRWRPYAFGRQVTFQWLPIPSGIPMVDNPAGVEAVRRRYTENEGALIGHFGTFGWPVTAILEPILSAMCDEPAKQTVLLMGIGSEKYRSELIAKNPRFGRIVQAAGALAPEDLSCHISACDFLIQPYPDGVSSRRTTFMVGLCHAKPVVTTSGDLTEPFWRSTNALALAPVGDVKAFVDLTRQLQSDPGERARMGRTALRLYQERFDISYSIAKLRQTACASEL